MTAPSSATRSTIGLPGSQHGDSEPESAPCYEAFASIVDSMVNQYVKFLKTAGEVPLSWSAITARSFASATRLASAMLYAVLIVERSGQDQCPSEDERVVA